MMFEKKSLWVVVLLDPIEGERYTEPVCDEGGDDELECIYQIRAQDQDWVHSADDRRISWERDSTCIGDSDEETD